MNKKKQVITIVLSVFITLAAVLGVMVGIHFFRKKALVSNRSENVTLVQLIATPEKYDGQRIRVVGVGNLEFEGNAIYLSKEDLSYRIYNAVWLDFDNNTSLSYEEAMQYNGKYVIVEGIFDKDNSGHGGLFHGAISNITRYELTWVEAELAEPESVN